MLLNKTHEEIDWYPPVLATKPQHKDVSELPRVSIPWLSLGKRSCEGLLHFQRVLLLFVKNGRGLKYDFASRVPGSCLVKFNSHVRSNFSFWLANRERCEQISFCFRCIITPNCWGNSKSCCGNVSSVFGLRCKKRILESLQSLYWFESFFVSGKTDCETELFVEN